MVDLRANFKEFAPGVTCIVEDNGAFAAVVNDGAFAFSPAPDGEALGRNGV
jgi:hypothetical protein